MGGEIADPAAGVSASTTDIDSGAFGCSTRYVGPRGGRYQIVNGHKRYGR
jgi:hypothetical protein